MTFVLSPLHTHSHSCVYAFFLSLPFQYILHLESFSHVPSHNFAVPSSSPLPSPSSPTSTPLYSSSVIMIPTPTQSPLPFTVTISRQTIELNMGETSSVTCMTNHPVENFIWTVNSQTDLPSNVVIRNRLQQSILTIANMELENTGLYQCLAVSHWTAESGAAIVSVIFRGVYIALYVAKNCNGK